MVRTGPRHEDAAHPYLAGALYVVGETVAHHDRLCRLRTQLSERLAKDVGVRLHVPVVGRRDGAADVRRQVEMLLQGRQTAVGVRYQPHAYPGDVQRVQRREHVVVQREVAASRPFVVDLAGTRVDRGSGGAHFLQHAAREPDEQLRPVGAAACALELD